MELSLALNTPGFVNKLREFLRRNSKSLNPSSKKEVLKYYHYLAVMEIF